MVDTLIMLVT